MYIHIQKQKQLKSGADASLILPVGPCSFPSPSSDAHLQGLSSSSSCPASHLPPQMRLTSLSLVALDLCKDCYGYPLPSTSVLLLLLVVVVVVCCCLQHFLPAHITRLVSVTNGKVCSNELPLKVETNRTRVLEHRRYNCKMYNELETSASLPIQLGSLSFLSLFFALLLSRFPCDPLTYHLKPLNT